jgi:hypothetical protein
MEPIYPWHEFDMGGGDIPPSNSKETISRNFFLVLKIITLGVILRHLEAELSILRCLKLIRGLFPLKQIFLVPHKLISG